MDVPRKAVPESKVPACSKVRRLKAEAFSHDSHMGSSPEMKVKGETGLRPQLSTGIRNQAGTSENCRRSRRDRRNTMPDGSFPEKVRD